MQASSVHLYLPNSLGQPDGSALSMQFLGDCSHMLPLKAGDGQFVRTGLSRAVVLGKCRSPVGRAAGNLVHVAEFRAGVWDPDDNHAVMQERGMEAGNCGLLAAMLRGSGRKDAPPPYRPAIRSSTVPQLHPT
jgi:hypothetical protein